MNKPCLAVICLMLAMAASQPALAEDDLCRELLRNESNLDFVYDLSAMVFIARIWPRGGPNPQIYNYELLEPVLKGTVPATGHITFAGECSPLNDESVYLFFLDSMQEKIADANAIFFSLTEEGPGFTWIAEWISNKLSSTQQARP
jgi:hypothetical protein